MTFVRLPPFARGQRIGLYGGSFSPPHVGHVMVARIALRRLRLDRVWWLVTPGNPLKDNRNLPALEERMAAARALIDDPRIVVTGLERDLGTHYTVDTLGTLKRRMPGVHLVWLMGGDNLGTLHRWGGWRHVMHLAPVAVIDRPGSTHKAVRSPAAQAFESARIDESEAPLLPLLRPPAWVFLHDRRSDLSSSEIRAGHAIR